MMRKLLDRLKQLPLKAPAMDNFQVAKVLASHNVEPWFLYAFEEWKNRWHVWRGLVWAMKHIERDGKVLETGCGCGWNLLWLAANGFNSLTGFDIDASAIAAGRELSQTAQYPLRLLWGDALDPGPLAEAPFRLLLALNWTYHVPSFELGCFLERYRGLLVPGGVLLLDTIKKSFNKYPKNQYLTSDWTKPQGERRPTEYLHRFNSAEVLEVATSKGFQIAKRFDRNGAIPRSVYLLRRN